MRSQNGLYYPLLKVGFLRFECIIVLPFSLDCQKTLVTRKLTSFIKRIRLNVLDKSLATDSLTLIHIPVGANKQ